MGKKNLIKDLRIDGVLEIKNKEYYIVKKEIMEEILELIEDAHDIKIARERLGKPSVSLSEAKRSLRV